MDIPKRIKYMGVSYFIKRPHKVEIDGEAGYGAYKESSLTVDIKADLPQELAEITFFHELGHIVMPEEGEGKVERYSRGWYHVLKENGLLSG
jgi:Zn-dependent peptidase ImmA (M78 family)